MIFALAVADVAKVSISKSTEMLGLLSNILAIFIQMQLEGPVSRDQSTSTILQTNHLHHSFQLN